MALHNKLGKSGEETAIRYLALKGYLIRDINWRKGHYELDIVAVKDDTLVVAEVKTRRNADFQKPEDAVDMKKIRRIVSAANTYIRYYGLSMPVRFDIITLVGEADNFSIEHIEDAFYPPRFN